MFDLLAAQLEQIRILIASLALLIAGASGGDIQMGNAQPEIPSIIAEGEVIEFPYTDENVGENFIIRTDKENYTPLWAWNGFDIYLMVKNESGKTQNVFASPFFLKDFTIESIALLAPGVMTIIKEPIYQEICMATTTGTTTECYTEKIGEQDKEVLGKWNTIANPTFLSEEDYSQFVADNDIPVKDKGNRKAKQKFGALFLKNQTAYFKIRLKAHEPFSMEEFDLEIIGDKGGYGLLDPTIFTDDFESYPLADINGQGGWTAPSGVIVQSTTTFEGSKAMLIGAEGYVIKSGTTRNDGKITLYINAVSSSTDNWLTHYLYESTTRIMQFQLNNSGIGAATVALYDNTATWRKIDDIPINDWFYLEIEWQSSDHKLRANVNGGTWSSWFSGTNNWSSGIDTIRFYSHPSFGNFIDRIAQDPVEEAVAETQMSVITIH